MAPPHEVMAERTVAADDDGDTGPVRSLDQYDIWTAAQLGSLFRVQQLVQEQPELAQAPGPTDQIPPLHWAALNNRVAVAKYLLERGAPVNALGGDQWSTALHWAASKGHLDMLGLLLSWGADLNMKDQPGYTPFHLAAQHGQTLAVIYFLALNVDVNQRDSFGRTPLLWAAFRGHLETAQVLIQEGAEIDAIDDGGMTVLHWAVIKNNFHVVRLLLKGRADPTVKDREGKTPLDWAISKGHAAGYSGLLIEFGRKSLLRGLLSPLQANYWRQPRSVGKFMLGRVVPVLFLAFMWLVLWKVSPWVLAVAVVFLVSVAFDNVLRPLLFPSVMQMETGMVLAYQLIMIPMSIILEFGTMIPVTREHWLLHLTWLLCTILALYFLRRVNSTDPGIIRAPLDREERQKVVLDLAADGELNRRRYCVTCRIRKPLRSKHCRVCDVCVAKFDHHCPWTNSCVGVGNHRQFIWYVYCVVGGLITYIWVSFLYLQTLDTAGVVAGRLCPLGAWMCKRAVAAPFVTVFLFEKIFFILWVSFLLVTQTWQIAKNKTTNEMSNWHRLEYFQVYSQEEEEEAEGEEAGEGQLAQSASHHQHGPHCRHHPHPHHHQSGGITKMLNPFDRGTFANCTNFCLGSGDHVYYELHQLTEMGQREAAPVPLATPKLEKKGGGNVIPVESRPLMGVHVV